jgi:hypothetical protein
MPGLDPGIHDEVQHRKAVCWNAPHGAGSSPARRRAKCVAQKAARLAPHGFDFNL